MWILAEGSFTDPDTIIRIINQVGVPIAILVFMGAAAAWYIWSFGPEHRANLRASKDLTLTLTEHVPKQTKATEDTARVLERLSDDHVDTRDAIVPVIAATIKAASKFDIPSDVVEELKQAHSMLKRPRRNTDRQ